MTADTEYKVFFRGVDLQGPMEAIMTPYVGKVMTPAMRQDMLAELKEMVVKALPPPAFSVHVAVLVFPKFSALYITELGLTADRLELLYVELLEKGLPREDIMKEFARVWPGFAKRTWSYEL